MPIKPLYPGTRDTFCDLDPGALDVVNYNPAGGANNPNGVSSEDPTGALSGAVAALVGSNLVDQPATLAEANKAVGLFVNNVRGTVYHSSSAVASGKGVYWADYGLYATNLYELRDDADSADLTYAAGDQLYSSTRGYLTKDATGPKTRALGNVVKAPTATDDYLVFRLRIEDVS